MYQEVNMANPFLPGATWVVVTHALKILSSCSIKRTEVTEEQHIFYNNSYDVGMAQRQIQGWGITQWSISHAPYMQGIDNAVR